jgi:hypothetical protein
MKSAAGNCSKWFGEIGSQGLSATEVLRIGMKLIGCAFLPNDYCTRHSAGRSAVGLNCLMGDALCRPVLPLLCNFVSRETSICNIAIVCLGPCPSIMPSKWLSKACFACKAKKVKVRLDSYDVVLRFPSPFSVVANELGNAVR